MRKKRLFYGVLVLYIAAIALFVWAAARNRHQRALPLLVEEPALTVPTREAVREMLKGDSGASEAVEKRYAEVRRLITRNGRFRLAETVEGAGISGDVVTDAVLDALEARKIAAVKAWDCRLLNDFAGQKLTAAEDRKAENGLPLITAGEPLDADTLFKYLVDKGLSVEAVLAGRVSLDGKDASGKPLGRVSVKGLGSIMGLNATMFLVGVNFLVLVVLLYALLWEPVIRILDERAEKIRAEIETAEEKFRESAALAEQRREELKEAQSEREALRAKGHEEGQQERHKVIEAARVEADKLKEYARQQMAAEEEAARKHLAGEVGSLSVALAAKILEKEVSRQTHEALIEAFVRTLRTETDGKKG